MKLNFPSAIISVRLYTEESKCSRVYSAASVSPRSAGVSRDRRRSRDLATPSNWLQYTKKMLTTMAEATNYIHVTLKISYI